MPLEIRHVWTLNSTGRGTAYDAKGFPTWWTFYIETTASTATVAIDSARNSSGPWVEIGLRNLSSASADFIRLEGPLLYVAPRVDATGSTDAIRVEAIGN